MKGNLESYWFQWGSKGKLMRKLNDTIKKLSKVSASLTKATFDLTIAHRHIDHCHKEINEMQMRDIRPILDIVCNEMEVSTEVRNCAEIAADHFHVAVRLPTVRFMAMDRYSNMSIRNEAINGCTRMLADAITKHILKGITRHT